MTTATIIRLADHRIPASPVSLSLRRATGAVVPFARRTTAASASPYQSLEEAQGALLKALAAHDVAVTKENAAVARGAPQAERDILRRIVRQARVASAIAAARACGSRLEADPRVLAAFTGRRPAAKSGRRTA